MNMPFLTMQALLGTDKRPPELPADDSEPGRLTQAIAATRDGSENAEALRLLRAAGVQAVCGLAGYRPPRADSALPEPCPPEPRASVDKAAVIDVLRQVLSSGSDRMRLEAFRLMLGAGKVLPPALLPQALELGRRTPSLRGPIALIAGDAAAGSADGTPHGTSSPPMPKTSLIPKYGTTARSCSAKPISSPCARRIPPRPVNALKRPQRPSMPANAPPLPGASAKA